jgi:hypothetical protein
MWPRWPAGLAAHQRAEVAVRLLLGLVALQAGFTVLALVLRPYISVLLNCIEVACGCLDVAYLCLTIAAYQHTRDAVVPQNQRRGDAYLTVKSNAVPRNQTLQTTNNRLSVCAPSCAHVIYYPSVTCLPRMQ